MRYLITVVAALGLGVKARRVNPNDFFTGLTVGGVSNVIDHQVGRPHDAMIRVFAEADLDASAIPLASYALLKSTEGVLVIAHDTLWRQSFNYKTPSRAAAIANPLNYLPADNNIAIRVAGDYPRTQYIDEFL